MKYCPSCRRHRSFKEFAANRSRRDGLQVNCRKCQKAYWEKRKARMANGSEAK